MPAAEDRVVDLLARCVEYGGVRIAVLGRAVCLHGLDAAVEGVVHAGDELPARQVVGVEYRHGLRAVRADFPYGKVERPSLGAVLEGGFQHADRHPAQLGERGRLQPGGDDDHLVQFLRIVLLQRGLRCVDDHRVAFVGRDQRHEPALQPCRGIGVLACARRGGRKDEEVEYRESQYEDEYPVEDVEQ